MSRRVILEFPDELSQSDLEDRDVLQRGKEAVVLELLRKGRISQGKAAQLMGISRQDLFDVMASHNIPMADFSPEEFRRQCQDADR